MAARRRKRPRTTAETFVVDSSVVLAWYFRDEASPYADGVAKSFLWAKAIVPAIWPVEIANALLTGERRGRTTESDATRFIRQFARLPITVDQQSTTTVWTSTMGLARQHQLSAYDAAYLELGMRLAVPLATLDDALTIAATKAGVSIYAPKNRG